MWHLLRCYLSGRHDYGVGREPGAIFLRCVHCGRRSNGWNVDTRQAVVPTRPVAVPVAVPVPVPVSTVSTASAFSRTASTRPQPVHPAQVSARVIPFQRTFTT
jgi:hypothetical protein